MPAFVPHSPEEIAHARMLYEETAASAADIARILGIHVNTFWRRVKLWGWARRALSPEQVHGLAIRAARAREESAQGTGQGTGEATGRRIVDDRRSSVERAEHAVRAQLDALEQMQARTAFGALSVIESERSARAIHALTRALREIEAIKREAAEAKGRGWRDEEEIDPDEAYRELSRLIEGIKQRRDEELAVQREQELMRHVEEFGRRMPPMASAGPRIRSL